MKISFISSALQQPRHQKRIITLSHFCKISLFYSTRDQYQVNLSGFSFEGINLGRIRNRSYWRRVVYIANLASKMPFVVDKNVYCTSPEQAMVACFFRKKVVLEVGDLHQAESKSSVYRFVDSFLLKRLAGLVVTSPYYLSGHFKKNKNFRNERALVLENKLPLEMSSVIEKYRSRYQAFSGEKKKLGLVGSIRYPEILKKIRDVVSKRDDLELHVYGEGRTDIFDAVTNCVVHGPFRNPEDLARIYASIDVNLIIYDANNKNIKLALPNKLYESIAFMRPVICAKDCALSSEVERLGIGVSTKVDDISTAIDSVFSEYEYFVKNIRLIPEEQYLDDQGALKEFIGHVYAC